MGLSRIPALNAPLLGFPFPFVADPYVQRLRRHIKTITISNIRRRKRTAPTTELTISSLKPKGSDPAVGVAGPGLGRTVVVFVLAVVVVVVVVLGGMQTCVAEVMNAGCVGRTSDRSQEAGRQESRGICSISTRANFWHFVQSIGGRIGDS